MIGVLLFIAGVLAYQVLLSTALIKPTLLEKPFKKQKTRDVIVAEPFVATKIYAPSKKYDHQYLGV